MLILAGVTIKAIFGDNGLINRSIQARFINNFNTVSELVNIYQSQYVIQNIIDKNDEKETSNGVMLPVTTKVSDSELTKIKTNIPTLEESIKHFSNVSNISQANLYWIDLELIEANVKHKYLIDIDNMQIYEYEGEYFFSKRWHVLQMGIGEGTTISSDSEQEELFDGWITLTLYYPSDATDKMWRIGEEGETRYDGNLSWEEYTGSVTVRLSQVENIWIKYNLNGETVIIPPLGQLLVDIEVEPTGGKQEQVKVKINYDEDAETKQYRLNGGNWLDYEGEFVVTENILIEAKGVKTENVYDTEGNLITTQKVTGKDAYFIKNIGTEINENLSAPTISQNGKNVTITYPDDATKKYYTINYGPVQEYTGEIELENPDDVVTGYYETTEGSSQRASSSGDSSYEYNTTEIPQSTDVLAGPTINVSSTATQATITLRTEKVARNIYIKLGSQSYQEYTEPVIVSSNMTISAYYVTYEDGEVSKTSYSKVTGLHQGDDPSVVIDAEPYPYGNTLTTDKVTVTITTDAESVEYSYDGIVYEIYTGSLEITSNCRIYARATNDYGTTTEYLDITNIGNTPATKKESLSVSITVTPEPKLTTTLIDSVKISISYDEKATEKYYSIGKHGTLQKYAGEFTITENCTIYAYARSSTGTGQAVKLIDNITTGIAEPVIEGNPLNSQASSKTKISIAFDKNAKTTRYEIDGSGLMDYMGEFEVYENCTIRAVNTNSLGQTSESTYTVTNIVAEAPYLLLDKGGYYLLKLPFPENSSGREYKYKADGEWKSYPSDGIIFIKPEKQDQVLENDEIKIKIEDENGKEINFNGDWYLLDVPASEIFTHISMRWDRIQPGEPNIILDTSEPAKEVTVSIVYPSTIVEKQYKVVYPDGTITDWQEYKSSFVVNQKGTMIYARGIDDAEVYSKEAMLTITNIDEESPVITLTADLENTQQKVGIKVAVTDDTNVSVIKWDKGNLGESYFEDNGNAIQNNSVVNINENGIYTFYAEDVVGNKQIYTLTISNVDTTPPQITINASPDKVGLESTITIDYGDSATKEYKIGTNTTTWSTYSEPITLTSYDMISLGVANEDYSFTVYARGIDEVGNEIIEEQKVWNLDLDMPSIPEITSNAGYPVLTEYGVRFDATTRIAFDSRTDITNYYSVDDGETWNVYKGQFDLNKASTIIAKSVKNISGLEVIASKTVSTPEDALGTNAYDTDENSYYTFSGTKKLPISESMQGQSINVTMSVNATRLSTGTVTVGCYGENSELLNSVSISAIGSYNYTQIKGFSTQTLEILEGTKEIRFEYTSDNSNYVYSGNIYNIEL